MWGTHCNVSQRMDRLVGITVCQQKGFKPSLGSQPFQGLPLWLGQVWSPLQMGACLWAARGCNYSSSFHSAGAQIQILDGPPGFFQASLVRAPVFSQLLRTPCLLSQDPCSRTTALRADRSKTAAPRGLRFSCWAVRLWTSRSPREQSEQSALSARSPLQGCFPLPSALPVCEGTQP